MFEVSVALKYLIPRWRQLSVSLITLISIIVISLVVWLVIVFLSVTSGIEKHWLDKLVSLNSPLRMTPTEAYYSSTYYQIDSLCAASNYSSKSIGEKLHTPQTNPYDPTVDAELPTYWPPLETTPDGKPKDLVKLAFDAVSSIKGIPGLSARDYEVTLSNMRIRLVRESNDPLSFREPSSQSFLSQISYVASYDESSSRLRKTLVPVSSADLTNFLNLLSLSADSIQQDAPSTPSLINQDTFRNRLHTFFDNVTITQLKTGSHGWEIPYPLLPKEGLFKVCALKAGPFIRQVIIPQDASKISLLQKELTRQGTETVSGTLSINQGNFTFTPETGPAQPLSNRPVAILENGIFIPAQLVPSSLDRVRTAADLLFDVRFSLQNVELCGQIRFAGLELGTTEIKNTFSSPPTSAPFWSYHVTSPNKEITTHLPSDATLGDGVLLAKSFQESGVLLGDRGYLSYYTSAAGSVQEQRIPIYVAGFYDPGIMPVGGKCVLAGRDVTALIRASVSQVDNNAGNGINVWFDDLNQANTVKQDLQKELELRGIDRYWHLESFRDYDFAKPLVQQFQSDKNLFTLIAVIIILVACSNIISMLILLVNDKKREIGIFLSMGASPKSIALIFGLCGISMGLISSLIGTVSAILTLQHLDLLVKLLSALQGFDAFNAAFYGDSLPNELSYDALTVVLIATVALSLLAGLIPAIKASLIRPTTILRSE